MLDNDPRPRPEEYFTPRSPVSPEMFARREEGRLQQRLEDGLKELGSQIMLYGDTGVGKTSLLLHVAEELGLGVARIECFSGKTFKDLIGDAFASIAEIQELRVEVSRTRGQAGEAEVGLGWLAVLKGRFRSEKSESAKVEFEVIEQPLIDALLDKLVESGKRIIFFDNFENIADGQVKAQVTEFIGFVSDRARHTDNVKVVLAGIADTPGDLLTLSDAASRRTIDFEVPRMPEAELEQIITRGMDFLRLRTDPAAIRRITNLSDGFPYVTHLLGLHTAREVQREESDEATGEHVARAVEIAVSEFREEFRTSYQAAKERSGEVRPREHIMKAIAWVDSRDFRASDIAEIYRTRFNIDANKDLGYLNVALGQLVAEAYGSVLRRRGSRGRYRYGFTNPLMGPYIRLVTEAEP